MPARATEITKLILHPHPHVDLETFPQEFWDQLADLENVEAVELVRMLLVLITKRIEGPAADSYSPELQAEACLRVLDLFKESIQ